MDFVFWQNIISIHQKAFLEALVRQPGAGKVILVVEHELTPVRKEMGWDAPRPEGVEVFMSPADAEVKAIVSENKDAVHVMGGIRIGRMVTAAFDACVQQKCRLGIMTEPYDDAGVKGKLRALKYRYYAAKYFRHINFVLAIGRQGVEQYTSLGYDARKLFGWAYFITLERQSAGSSADDGIVKIIYAGRLEQAKGILRFVTELVNTGKKNFRLDIFGTGSDEETIRALLAEKGYAEQVTITRFIKYQELLGKYPAYDWVVLPSMQKDGWGVIVSEGLLNGLKAICSNICGVSWVIKNGDNGIVFDWKGKPGYTCKKAIAEMLEGKGFSGREEIAGWANRTISGEAGAQYFMKITDNVYNGKEKPGAPWLR